jgi:hypothetical protein
MIIRKYDLVEILNESYLLDSNEKPVGLKVGETGKVMDIKENTDGVDVYMVCRITGLTEEEKNLPRIIQYPYHKNDLKKTTSEQRSNILRPFDMVRVPVELAFLDDACSSEPASETFNDKYFDGIIVGKGFGRSTSTFVIDTVYGTRIYISNTGEVRNKVKILDHCYNPTELLFKCKGLIENNPT